MDIRSDNLRDATHALIESLPVPAYDANAISRKLVCINAARSRPSPVHSRRPLLVALGVILLAIPVGAVATSSVSERLRLAFAPLGIAIPKNLHVSRSIAMSLDEVRKKSPFHIVIPRAYPSGVHLVRSEFSESGSTSVVYLHFSTTGPKTRMGPFSIGVNPEMVISESGRRFGPTNLGFVMITGLDDANPRRATVEKIHPGVWRAGNTWITVMSPGALAPSQLDQIRRALGAAVIERAGKAETIAPKRDRPKS